MKLVLLKIERGVLWPMAVVVRTFEFRLDWAMVSIDHQKRVYHSHHVYCCLGNFKVAEQNSVAQAAANTVDGSNISFYI